jgi:hypothetical protein
LQFAAEARGVRRRGELLVSGLTEALGLTVRIAGAE